MASVAVCDGVLSTVTDSPGVELAVCDVAWRIVPESDFASGFWFQMTMEQAMELGVAVAVTFALAWGISAVVRRVLFNK